MCSSQTKGPITWIQSGSEKSRKTFIHEIKQGRMLVGWEKINTGKNAPHVKSVSHFHADILLND